MRLNDNKLYIMKPQKVFFNAETVLKSGLWRAKIAKAIV